MTFFRRIYSFDFMSYKYVWFAVSIAIVATGLGSLLVRGGGNPLHGLNYGLEFKEGTRIAVAFEQSPSLAEVRRTLAEAGYGDAQIQQTANISDTGAQGFQIQTHMMDSEEQSALRSTLDGQFGLATVDDKEVWSLETVSASFGRQVVSSSLKAIGLAFVLILLYITLRFQWKFAVGAITALMHDLVVVIGICSLTGREVTTATIAAVLTILGYSLYDTVIIFDRIRENEPRFGRLPYGALVDRSIWGTLTRSINTSLTTLLPVLCLLFFGGATLKDFAFALMVGIISGAYSSIFVATSVLTVLKEREPRYRKIRAAERAGQA